MRLHVAVALLDLLGRALLGLALDFLRLLTATTFSTHDLSPFSLDVSFSLSLDSSFYLSFEFTRPGWMLPTGPSGAGGLFGFSRAPQEALRQAADQWRRITERLGVQKQRQAYRHSLQLE